MLALSSRPLVFSLALAAVLVRVPAASAQRSTVPPANRAPAGPPSTDVYLVPLAAGDGLPKIGAPANLTHREGYDNQPSFAPNSRSFFYTSTREDGQSDIYRFDLSTGLATVVRKTKESEYSAELTADTSSILAIRVELDSTQRLWRIPLGNGEAAPAIADIKPVGYFAQPDDSTLALFVLGSPATLQIWHKGRAGVDTAARIIGRSVLTIPGTSKISYVQKGDTNWFIMQYDPRTRRADTLVRTLGGTSEDIAWIDGNTLISAKGTKVYGWKRGTPEWIELGDLKYAALDKITRVKVSPNGAWLALVAEPQKREAVAPAQKYPDDKVSAASVKKGIDILAGDAMEGRATASPGSDRAAAWIAEQFKAAGLVPAGDSGTFIQSIPIDMAIRPPVAGRPASNRPRPSLVRSWSAWDSLPADRKRKGANVVGMVKGSDPVIGNEVVLVTAHYDHIGISAPSNGDSINNGADDDASGTISIIEMAKLLTKGPKPKRTIVFAAVTGEEVGGIGSNWYIEHPVLPLAQTVVDLNMEMIARPDTLAGGFGKAWLTGYERSTMGDLLSANAMPLVPDPRPGQNFFGRSDNIAFARMGIVSHTISSFNLHPDYHTVRDNPNTVDADHMAAVISATAKALRFLSDGPRPSWHPGGQPAPRQAPATPRGP